jgi:glycosyltransferase involved in cell wall biosynthesis
MKKIKILALCDHPLSPTGVGTQARWLIDGLIGTGRYTFRCFGGAVKHDKYDTVIVNDDLTIKPVDGFGEPNLLRATLIAEKPDVLFLFTDPRFFVWVWEMSDEVHSVCPIAYNHLWDCDPYPAYNAPFYNDTDLINCINKPTYDMLVSRYPDKVNFVPHAVPSELFYPETEQVRLAARQQLLNVSNNEHFVALWIARNARRKRPNDMLAAWADFIHKFKPTHGATLIMHTNPTDQEGPNLLATAQMLGVEKFIKFSTDIVNFDQMRILYAMSDVVINTSMNEGFGVPTLEAMYCGKPIIAPMTGGLTHQLTDYRNGNKTGIGLEPDVRTLIGGQLVPYIFEDLVKTERFTNALIDVFNWGHEKRKQVGETGRQYATHEFSMKRLITSWDDSLTKLVSTWKKQPRLTVIK